MTSLAFYLLLCCWIFPRLLFAQTNQPAAPTYPSNRYLLVVETSRAMQNRAEMMYQTVQGLLNSTLASQARRGDSLGVWTFNDELYTGQLPLQQWVPENQKPIAEHVLSFLRSQKFEKPARLDKVMVPLLRLVKSSPFLTITLVCAGDEEVHGTPFDQRINEYFQTWRQQQQEARAPFVVVLRAQAGRLVALCLNSSPWPVELPALPKELFVALPRPRPRAAAQKKAAAEVPPLIVIGKKHATALATTNAASIGSKASAAVAETTNLALPSPAIAQSNNSQSPSAAARTQAEGLSQSAPASSSVAASALSGMDSPKPAQPPDLHSPRPQPPAPEHSLTKPSATAAQTSGNEPAIPAGSAFAPVAAGDKSSASSAAVLTRAGQVPLNLAAETPPRGRSDLTVILLAGFAFFGAALAAVWVWRRRARGTGEVSLITESIDRRER